MFRILLNLGWGGMVYVSFEQVSRLHYKTATQCKKVEDLYRVTLVNLTYPNLELS